jgi:hypothetical protein
MDMGRYELETVQRMVSMTNALIELQRELIEHLNKVGSDVAVAKQDYDGLMMGLAAWVQQRQRVRASELLPRSDAA